MVDPNVPRSNNAASSNHSIISVSWRTALIFFAALYPPVTYSLCPFFRVVLALASSVYVQKFIHVSGHRYRHGLKNLHCTSLNAKTTQRGTKGVFPSYHKYNIIKSTKTSIYGPNAI
jgi:hypothetical protein